MSRWGKNIVVPLDSLCKEKEYTNRPTVARSVGTVGKWGKMGFTSTRTYSLSALPAVVAAAAAAASSVSPVQSPASALDDEMSPSVPEPPKPKKFFKSRNTAPPEVIAQIIQHLPSPSSNNGEYGGSSSYTPNTPVHHNREPIKLKLPKSNSVEKKKKSPRKAVALVKPVPRTSTEESTAGVNIPAPTAAPSSALSEPKAKKKKEEKKLKPEAAPSRVISRARKAINYCEDDDEALVAKRASKEEQRSSTTEHESDATTEAEPFFPLPAAPILGAGSSTPVVAAAAKTPEHPPIVLRISKGTSRLVSTDSEELPTNTTTSPQHDSTGENASDVAAVAVNAVADPHTAAKSKLQLKPMASAASSSDTSNGATPLLNENNEINYCTVKISPDKPPKERLKLIIKTDVIRNAIAAAAAAAKSSASAEKPILAADIAAHEVPQRVEKEKRSKSKKHKHPKHSAVEQLQPTMDGSEFKTPSPHLALGFANAAEHPRNATSPAALSERDFDSQSSVLGSSSSKGNSTPSQAVPPTTNDETCLIRSRGSSVITSDLETSQHSSLVAPPSDIESRLESMMMDGEVSQRATQLLAEEEPLQEDILAVLRGEESQTAAAEEAVKMNGNATEPESETINAADSADEQEQPVSSLKRRATRGRGRLTAATVTKTVNDMETEADDEAAPAPKTTKARGKKGAAQQPAIEEHLSVLVATKRTTRRGAGKKSEESASSPSISMELDETPPTLLDKSSSPNKSEEENIPAAAQPSVPMMRRARATRNARHNNNLHNSNNNNNINKIAAHLSAKAGAAEAEAKITTIASLPITQTNNQQRGYGRKRKNQQVTQVLQPSAAELEEQQQHSPTSSKLQHIDLPAASQTSGPAKTKRDDNQGNSNTHNRPVNSAVLVSMSARSDYKIKDRFKRTLMLDGQVNCNAVVSAGDADMEDTHLSGAAGEDDQQRGSVKLVISKKKGSIFKSRALVPADQSDQLSAAAKRHLYKHRWDAEGNDVFDGSGKTPPTNEAPKGAITSRKVVDSVFDDFGEDLSASGGSTRDSSPAPGKFARVIKSNPQALPSGLDTEFGVTADQVITTTTKVDRKTKEHYMVVRNVKTAHQIQEIGEYQEMADDVQYILDALQPKNSMPTRCLSALQLATKCMTPAFRMHVRAHGVVSKFFKALSDANTDLSLGLCASAIMYILSQEGLNMDLDRDSLELMMNLLESEGVAAPSDQANYDRNRQKVRELCEDIKAQGKATHLNVDAITVGTLAMETLLSLTSKRAGDWFKEELRELGGLEHIIKTISDCCQPLFNGDGGDDDQSATCVEWTQPLLENMQTVARCMRVLENVTQMNEKNQTYMLTFSKSEAVKTFCTLYRLCDRELMLYPTSEFTSKDNPGVVLRELLIPLMKVLINLTHTFKPTTAIGAELLGQRAEVIDVSFHLLLQASNYIPDRCIFELTILVLLLLINLSMYTVANRVRIMKAYAPTEFGLSHGLDDKDRISAVQSLMEYFYKCEELARLVEKNTDALLDNTDKNKKKQEEVDETVNNLLQKAGHHMEHTLKGSYAAILVGHLITDSEEFEAVVRQHLHGNGFKEIISVLEKYYNFMNLTASSEAAVLAHIKSTKEIIDYFKKRDLVYNMSAKAHDDDSVLPLNLETHSHAANSISNDITANHAHNSTENAAVATTSTSSATTAAGTATRSLTQRIYKTYSQR